MVATRAMPVAALATCALMIASLCHPAAGSMSEDIIAAVQRIAGDINIDSAKSSMAVSDAAGTAAAGAGMQTPVLKQQRYTKMCGTGAPTATEMAAVKPVLDAADRFELEEDAARRAAAAGNAEARLLVNNWGPLLKQVSVHWHVIQSGRGYRKGGLSRAVLDRQMAVLNLKFRKANIRFNLVSVDYTTNADWFRVVQGSDTEVEMKEALHRGSMRDLNVYSAAPRGTVGEPVAGFTKLPMFSQDAPQLDGCTILFDTLPGGRQPGMNLGMTLVHEVGHWLGLQHTFDNGCNVKNGGDWIGDTPYEAKPSYDCRPKNTCPNTWGMDPITNPMNYSPDECMTQFTTMQAKRMRAQWYAFRK